MEAWSENEVWPMSYSHRKIFYIKIYQVLELFKQGEGNTYGWFGELKIQLKIHQL